MTNAELQDALSQYPDTAKIYIVADHGQMPEQASNMFVTTETPSAGEFPYYGEDLDWIQPDDVGNPEVVTAIQIY